MTLYPVDSLSNYFYFYDKDSIILGQGLFLDGQQWGEWSFRTKSGSVVKMNYHNGKINGIVRYIDDSLKTKFIWMEVQDNIINGYYFSFDEVIRYYGHYNGCSDDSQNQKGLIGIDTYSSHVPRIVMLPLIDYFSDEIIDCE